MSEQLFVFCLFDQQLDISCFYYAPVVNLLQMYVVEVMFLNISLFMVLHASVLIYVNLMINTDQFCGNNVCK